MMPEPWANMHTAMYYRSRTSYLDSVGKCVAQEMDATVSPAARGSERYPSVVMLRSRRAGEKRDNVVDDDNVITGPWVYTQWP